jgi:hypothetical protein
MALYKKHIAGLITSTLQELGHYSDSARELLLGTLAIESDFGTFLRQRSKYVFDINIHGLGIYQIEKETFEWLRNKYQDRFPFIGNIKFEQLEYDLRASIIFARLRYLAVTEPLPFANDIHALARYWKKYYNASKYGQTEQDFINKYYEYVIIKR